MSSGFSGTAWDDFFDPLGVLSYRSSCSEFFRRKSTSAVSCWILVTTLFVQPSHDLGVCLPLACVVLIVAIETTHSMNLTDCQSGEKFHSFTQRLNSVGLISLTIEGADDFKS